MADPTTDWHPGRPFPALDEALDDGDGPHAGEAL
jgi:hypothetical protein